MITNLILNVIFAIPYLLLQGLDSLNFNLTFPNDMFEIIKDMTVGVSYVVPIARLMPIFVSSMSLVAFKIIWALIIRIKSFIPTMGS